MSITFENYYIPKQTLRKSLLVAVLIAATISLLLYNTVFAIWFKDLCVGIVQEMMDGIGGIATDCFAKISSINAEESFATAIATMTSLGTGFALIFMIFKMITEIQSAQDPVECIFKCFFELCVTVLIIQNIQPILSAVDLIGADIVAGLTEAQSAFGLNAEDVTDEIREGLGFSNDWIGFLQLAMNLIIPNILNFVQKILVRVASYSIIIELFVRRIFVPFAIADIGYEGMRSQGFRYMKKYLGVYFKEAILLAVCQVCVTISTTVVASKPSISGNSPTKAAKLSIVPCNPLSAALRAVSSATISL